MENLSDVISAEPDRRMAEIGVLRGRIRGSLVGGAVGDALGWPVEFLPWEVIKRHYGPDGIREYRLDNSTGTAVITDDTQMTLFTANGILTGETQNRLKGLRKPLADYVYIAYLEWLDTQRWRKKKKEPHACWLYGIKALHEARAPGNTCLASLESGEMGRIGYPINHSKGCGGVMRVAPAALFSLPRTDRELEQLDLLGAELAAVTHSHPLAYIPAAIMTHIISLGLCGQDRFSLDSAAADAWKTVRYMFREFNDVTEEHLDAMERLLDLAVSLAKETGDDEAHIRTIGGGWVGDEALAIALYCCLRYPHDFSKAIISAVNHGGDSDSTGAIAGNILGAWLGDRAIDGKWKQKLEMQDVLLEIADDLCDLDSKVRDGSCTDEAWLRKYREGSR